MFMFYALSAYWLKEFFCLVKIMISDKKIEWAIETLHQKREELGRLPKKSDFDVVTMSRIKAFLGPWPRALETAGLKEAKKKQR